MPADGRRSPTRRQFLRRTALLAGAPALAGVLGACSGRDNSTSAPTQPMVAPDRPVTWDILTDNTPVPVGLGPEKGATLRLFTYRGYIAPESISTFEEEYGVKVEVSTFNNTDEALTRIMAGGVDFDLYTPGYDQLGRLVPGGLLRPINHRYVPNITNVWPTFQNPWYDREWRYSVPYTVYTTGIAWRADQISTDIAELSNPYAALWDPAYRNKTAIIDDWHTAMAMVLLKLGVTDVNTSSSDDLLRVGDALEQLQAETAPAVSVEMFSDLPAGRIGVAQIWSGDIVNAVHFLPDGVEPDVLRYWFPADGKGMVDNDLMVSLRAGRNPVAAHLFINHMLEPEVATMNFAASGYQPPQLSLGPDSSVVKRMIPESLRAAIVRPEYFDVGYRILALDPANNLAWQKIWRDFKTRRS